MNYDQECNEKEELKCDYCHSGINVIYCVGCGDNKICMKDTCGFRCISCSDMFAEEIDCTLCIDCMDDDLESCIYCTE